MRLCQRSFLSTEAKHPGCVVTDQDQAGNVLYGPFQFATHSGTTQAFINWLNAEEHSYGRILAKWSPGSREFSAAWMYLGDHDPEGFYELQARYYQLMASFPPIKYA